jgi:hypothetical protein
MRKEHPRSFCNVLANGFSARRVRAKRIGKSGLLLASLALNALALLLLSLALGPSLRLWGIS